VAGSRNGTQMVTLPAVVTLEHDEFGDVYVAHCLAVEVTSHGDTPAEALDKLRKALELYFEDTPVPDLPASPRLTSVDVRVPA
jgi:predicted RNase H-like HicB family nuclease